LAELKWELGKRGKEKGAETVKKKMIEYEVTRCDG
jgi:hypothetical protein